jgi:hypothetical protein
MTFAFPITPDMRARLDAREDAVTAARAILRSQAQHLPDDIRLACETLMTWGDGFDWADAYHVLRALDVKPVKRPQYSPQVGAIRDGLLFLGFAVAVLIVGLAA